MKYVKREKICEVYKTQYTKYVKSMQTLVDSFTNTELCLATQIMRTLPVAAPGCPDSYLSKSSVGVEEQGAFSKGKTRQEFST